MILKRLHLVLFVVVGLFTFNTPVESPRLPQIAQTELVVFATQQTVVAKYFPRRPEFLVLNESLLGVPHHVRYEFYLVESQHHHSSL